MRRMRAPDLERVPEWTPPAQIDEFRVVRPLGAGTMGQVYLAHDTVLDRPVAIKFLVLRDPAHQARLLVEARATARLQHPNVLAVHQVGSVDGHPFLVTEFLRGTSLAALPKPLAWQEVVRIGIGLARGLAAAHRSGVLHRDIKPANAMLTEAGEVKLLDFGLAKLVAPATEPPAEPVAARPAAIEPRPEAVPTTGRAEALPTDSTMSMIVDGTLELPPAEPTGSGEAASLTRAGSILGTPLYMAPEAWRGEPATPRTDVYALGAVLYELATGNPPHAARTLAELATRVQEHAAPTLIGCVPGAPAALAGIVASCLERDPAARYASAEELLEALEHLDSAGSGVSPGPAVRWRRGWTLIVAVVGGTAVALAIWLRPLQQAAPALRLDSTRRLTVEPGCEEYPRFTPGGEIVYDGLVEGDYEILALDPKNGVRRRLTHSAGWDVGPVVSPDGKHVAYVHFAAGKELRVVPIGGDREAANARTLSAAVTGYPSWTADGALLIPVHAQIHRITLDGRDEILPISLPAEVRPQLVQSVGPDTLVVVYALSGDTTRTHLLEVRGGTVRQVADAENDNPGGLGHAPAPGAYYVTAKGAAEANQVLRRQLGGDALVVPGALSANAGLDVASDGSALVFSTCQETNSLALLGRDGTLRPLGPGAWRDSTALRVDDRRLLFTSDRSGQQQVWLLDVPSGASSAVGPPQSYGGAASPDASTVVFVRPRDGLWTVPVAGGQPRRLTSDRTDAHPRFSFDGKQVVFERSSAGEPARVWLVASDGSGAHPIGPPASFEPTPSPVDGTLVYVDRSSGTASLQRGDLAGGTARPLGLDGRAPRFSADGGRLLFVQQGIRIMEARLDGTAAPRVLHTATTEGFSTVDYAPDGRGFVISVDEYSGDLWLAQGRFP